MRLLTIDILDTTLIRICGAPHTIFYLLAHKQFPDDRVLRTIFLQWRTAEKPKDYSISDIYAPHLIPSTLKALYCPEEMIREEMEMEYRNLMANPEISELLEKKRKEGWMIKFVSDMYLSSEFFKSKLKEAGIYRDGDEVIVSCEWRARKDDGTIYEKIRDKYHPKEWVHIGDNIHSDVKMARRKGIKAQHMRVAFTDEEKSMYKNGGTVDYAWQAQYLAGLCRAARIGLGNTPFAHMGADYVMPSLLPFVRSVTDDVEQRGIKTLHFLSRDGYLMHEMAKYLLPKTVALHYTFISRKALTSAFLHVCTLEEFCQLYENPEFRQLSTDEILSRYFELGRQDLHIKFGIQLNTTSIIDKKNWERFAKDIFSCTELIKFIRERTAAHFTATLLYLKKHNVLGPNTAIADIGWLGHTRLMLSAIARASSNNAPLFYYFCVTDNVLSPKFGPYIVYHSHNKYPILCHTPMLESYFCASPYPTTIGYDIDNHGNPIHISGDKSPIDNNPIWDANIKASKLVLQALRDSGAINYIPSTVLDNWGMQSMSALFSYRYPLDYSVFTHAEGITRGALAKKFTFRDFLFFGKHTDFKFADIAITFGYRGARSLWWIRDIAIKAIDHAYRRLKQ